MKIYIGIDPSMSSSGISVSVYDDDNNFVYNHFYIIHLGKLTKGEIAAEKECEKHFKYLCYDKVVKSGEYFIDEKNKTLGIFDIVKWIDYIFNQHCSDTDTVYVCMESVSYGSTKTTALCDLAGLNYLIRQTIQNRKNFEWCVCPPSVWKKWAVGYGDASKSLVSETFLSVRSEFSNFKKVDDISDSYFIMKYCMYIYEGTKQNL